MYSENVQAWNTYLNLETDYWYAQGCPLWWGEWSNGYYNDQRPGDGYGDDSGAGEKQINFDGVGCFIHLGGRAYYVF